MPTRTGRLCSACTMEILENRNGHRTGTNFQDHDPPLLMAELQYRINQDKDLRGLAGSTGWAAGIISENSTI